MTPSSNDLSTFATGLAGAGDLLRLRLVVERAARPTRRAPVTHGWLYAGDDVDAQLHLAGAAGLLGR